MNEKHEKLTKLTKVILLIPLFIAGMVLFIAVGGTVVMLLWNWLAPELFGLQLISFWQAVGLLALCRILFGGFGFSGRSHRYSNRRIDQRIRERLNERMRERRDQMSLEEREREGILTGNQYRSR